MIAEGEGLYAEHRGRGLIHGYGLIAEGEGRGMCGKGNRNENLDMKISDMMKRVAVIEKDHAKIIGKGIAEGSGLKKGSKEMKEKMAKLRAMRAMRNK